jgi:tetratricopeptide (TPR) repeat protein
MKSPRERLLGAQAELRGAAAAPDRASAHLAAFEAYGDLAMMQEARSELEQARVSVTPTAAARQRELDAHDVMLALLEGDYARATVLLGVDGAGPARERDWLPRFLLRRELGMRDEDEADLRSRAASDGDSLARLALALLLLDRGRSNEAGMIVRIEAGSVLDLALSAEVAFLLDDALLAETVYPQLLRFSGRQAIAQGRGSVGAVDRYLGLAAGTLGSLDDAVEHLDAAIRINERMGATPWRAHAEHDLGDLLGRRRAAGDAARAATLKTQAEQAASALGMVVLLQKLGRHAQGPVARPPTAVMTPPHVPVTTETASPNVFRRDGDYWTVRYDGAIFSVRDTKGMQYLARLLAAPGVEFHALDLASDGASPARGADATSRASASELGTTGLGNAGDVLDPKAREDYRTRIRELDAEIAEAEEWNDPERLTRLQTEREFLVDEISAAVGLSGRSRQAASAAERARLNVGKTIRSAIDRIETYNPALGRHLSLAVHTGSFCSYTPDPALNIVWVI